MRIGSCVWNIRLAEASILLELFASACEEAELYFSRFFDYFLPILAKEVILMAKIIGPISNFLEHI